MFTPFCPNAGPTGGAGVAPPAGICNLTKPGIGYMLIDGHKAFIIGNICMDLLMLDVSDIDVKEGDKVMVFSSEQPLDRKSTR